MRLIAVLFACLLVPTYVEAKPSQWPVTEFAGDRYVARVVTQKAAPVRYSANARYYYRVKKKKPTARYKRPARPYVSPTLVQGFVREVRTAAGVIGGRPAGCPSRFCGCGASIHLFGRIIPRLNLAANWLAFPRTSPAHNMVAARRGHVFVLKEHIRGNVWLVFDSNSGRGRTRLHHRSIAGYVIVNPHGRA